MGLGEERGIGRVQVRCEVSSNATCRPQRLLQQAILSDRLRSTILAEQLLGSLGEHPPYLPPLALVPLDLHQLVGRGLVPHPGDDGRFGPLINGNSLRPGHRAAADRVGMIGYGTDESVGEIGVDGVECQELDYSCVKVLDVFGLSPVPASGIGLLPLCLALGGSLGLRFNSNALDGRCRCPNAP